MRVLFIGIHPSTRSQRGNTRFPYTSPQLHWIISQTVTQVYLTSMIGQNNSSNLVAAKPPLARTISTQGYFVYMPSIMSMECVLEKYHSRPSPVYGAILDSTKCVQVRFSQSLYAFHKGICVIIVINFFGGGGSN